MEPDELELELELDPELELELLEPVPLEPELLEEPELPPWPLAGGGAPHPTSASPASIPAAIHTFAFFTRCSLRPEGLAA